MGRIRELDGIVVEEGRPVIAGATPTKAAEDFWNEPGVWDRGSHFVGGKTTEVLADEDKPGCPTCGSTCGVPGCRICAGETRCELCRKYGRRIR